MEFQERLLERVDSLASEIFAVSRFVHAHPELGHNERQAVSLLAKKLRGHGFKIETPLKEMPTAFRASIKGRGKGPALGFISEYDALPEIGHGCGHNLIAASGFGTAVALAPFVKELGGSVSLFGTPAEETDGAKVPMAAKGVFDGVDAIVMMHPEGMYLVNTSALALDALNLRFHGMASHAAATPWEGLNALDAMIQLFNSVAALRQQMRPDARVHGIITKGGSAPNVIPDDTAAQFYVRAKQRAYCDELTRKVSDCARGAALATGCTVKISRFENSYDDIINNPVLARLVTKNLERLGVEKIEKEDPVPGSSDFGNLSHRIPSVYFYCATAPHDSPLHTAEFARLSLTRVAHENLIIAIKTMALTGLELLRNPKLVAEIKRAHPKHRRTRAGHDVA